MLEICRFLNCKFLLHLKICSSLKKGFFLMGPQFWSPMEKPLAKSSRTRSEGLDGHFSSRSRDGKATRLRFLMHPTADCWWADQAHRVVVSTVSSQCIGSVTGSRSIRTTMGTDSPTNRWISFVLALTLAWAAQLSSCLSQFRVRLRL